MSFTADISKFVERANGNADKVIRKVLFDIGTKIVMRSPVGDAVFWKSPPPKGYVGGRFRGNWQYGFGMAPSSELDSIDKSGSVSTGRITAGVMGSPAIGIHYLVNNLPYAMRLENGWSRQAVAPAAIVGRTVLEFQSMVEEAVAKL